MVTMCCKGYEALQAIWYGFCKPAVLICEELTVIKAKKTEKKGASEELVRSRTLGSRVKNCLFALFLILYVTLCDSHLAQNQRITHKAEMSQSFSNCKAQEPQQFFSGSCLIDGEGEKGFIPLFPDLSWT